MSYKPKYCCQCGVEIERSEWKMWTNRRFCKLCETDHVLDQFRPYIKGIGAVLVILLIGFYFYKPEKPPTVVPNQFVGSAGGNKIIAANQNIAPVQADIPATAHANGNVTTAKMPVMLKASDVKAKPADNLPVETPEKTYFCGAETKKGAPCSRRVKGGGRCWQHIGQAAMLAQEKLIAVQ